GTSIRWSRKNIISKSILTFCCDLNIISRLQLSILHIVVFHSHKSSIKICFRITVSFSKYLHIFCIFLFSINKVFYSFQCLLRKLSLRTDFFTLTPNFTLFNFIIIIFYLFVYFFCYYFYIFCIFLFSINKVFYSFQCLLRKLSLRTDFFTLTPNFTLFNFIIIIIYLFV